MYKHDSKFAKTIETRLKEFYHVDNWQPAKGFYKKIFNKDICQIGNPALKHLTINEKIAALIKIAAKYLPAKKNSCFCSWEVAFFGRKKHNVAHFREVSYDTNWKKN